jgi:CTP:phosphocholine cytidylyltransferase-like protein
MDLSRDQFEILSFLEQRNRIKSDVGFSGIGFSPEAAGEILAGLRTDGLIGTDDALSAKGLDTLEPYRAKRAIFMAAGFGSRMVPVTLNTPKPLVRVGGVRIIDTLLDAVLAAGISEIYIVRGYLGEQFDQLLYKYPMIRFLENPLYNESNNISSAVCARYFFRNAWVFESDLFLRNPKLITRYQYASNYLGVPVEETGDWCLQTRDGTVSGCSYGGKNCYHWFGISYWTGAEGSILAEHLKQSWDIPERRKQIWDYTPLKFYHEHYHVEVRECTFDDITEIDSFAELQALDETYRV